jgi:hypothetical protein
MLFERLRRRVDEFRLLNTLREARRFPGLTSTDETFFFSLRVFFVLWNVKGKIKFISFTQPFATLARKAMQEIV